MRSLKTRRMLLATAAATALAAVSAGMSGPTAAAAVHPAELTSSAPATVVAGGLDGPRSLAWGPRGHLLVAQAGTPDTVCDSTDPATQTCYGLTGSISDVSSGTPVPIVTGLASYRNGQEGVVVGPSGLIYARGHLYTQQAESPQLVPSSGLPADLGKTLKQQYGAVLRIGSRSVSAVANPGKADYEWTQAHPGLAPDGPAANPNALTRRPGGGFYVVDAAANTLDSVDRHGRVTVLTSFPRTPAGTDAVPTCLDVGPDGAVYIGQFTGFGSSATDANVYRYAPRSGELSVWQTGFSAINGCGFGVNGDFYVTELDTTGVPPTGAPDGVVIQIGRDGTRTVLGAGKLFAPAGFLAGPDGSVYVANNTMTSGHSTAGQIVKLG